MIIETVVEGENYYKQINSNLIGRKKQTKFKDILYNFISIYKESKKEQKNGDPP